MNSNNTLLKRADFEIMAPVGSWESLAAAIQAGADSIYFGIENLNMRSRSSSNFTTDDLRTIVQQCNEHGVKLYLTINTIIYDDDLALMRTIVDTAKEAGVSAIIAAIGANLKIRFAFSYWQSSHLAGRWIFRPENGQSSANWSGINAHG